MADAIDWRTFTDSFLFRGHNMKTEFGIWCRKKDFLLPPMRRQKIEIPFRDGAYEFYGDYYGERIIECLCDMREGMPRDKLRYLAKLFNMKSRIVFWDEPGKYYVGRIYDDKGINQITRGIREFTLSFQCDPFAYGPQSIHSLPIRFEDADVYNGTSQTPTRIVIENTGETPITQVIINVKSRTIAADPISNMDYKL